MARAMLFGTPISPGIAIGSVHFLHRKLPVKKRHINIDAIPAEQTALREAVSQVRLSFEKTLCNIPQDLQEYRDIISAQMEMARDTKLLDASLSRIQHSHICASWALSQTIEELCAMFESMDDAYLRDRAQDVRSVGLRICEFLVREHQPECSALPQGILAAEDLSPADVVDGSLGSIYGLLTEQGGTTSHTAILARGQRIPAIAGINDLLNISKDGEMAIINGLEGYVLLGPDNDDLRIHKAKQQQYADFEARTTSQALWPAETSDGVRINIEANLENARELDDLVSRGAEGIGLYRTEFAFLADYLPSEEDLYQEYARITTSLSDRRIIFRTLDVGADKMMRLQNSPSEANPALGLRGIRFCLRHQGLFQMQLRAILRAAVYGNVAIMLPLISTQDELLATRRILQDLQRDLASAHIPHAEDLPLGAMIETPAAALIADKLASQCDFFSIGTNDLVHYLMAIDRNNRQVSYLHEPLHPAVLRAIKAVIDAGHREGISVSVCGELTNDPVALALLLGMGIDGLSAAPLFLPGLKHAIRQMSFADCMDLASDVLRSSDTKSSYTRVYEYLLQRIGPEISLHGVSLASQLY